MSKVRVETGMIHGRFQPFHLGHMTFAALAKELCDFLIVGVTNPDPRHYRAMEGDEKRHLAESNPFTFYERHLMIKASMAEAGFGPESFTVVPFPIDTPELWRHYASPSAVNFLRDRGDWTRTKMELLMSNGWRARMIEDAKDLDVHGTEVRRRMAHKQDWESLVPGGAARVIRLIDLPSRLGFSETT